LDFLRIYGPQLLQSRFLPRFNNMSIVRGSAVPFLAEREGKVFPCQPNHSFNQGS
jgi:hypothetical protein